MTTSTVPPAPPATERPAPLTDRFGRPLRDLRVSVTDRCNFRCGYCMPREVFGPGFAFLPRHELLTFEEVAQVVAAFARAGVGKVRLTGGEPLMRRDVVDLVRLVRSSADLDDLALTTNGSLLPRLAEPLRAAGLGRVTVSLDALDDALFRAMSDVDLPVAAVLDGIAAAAAAGFSPVKVNAVVKRGVNDDQVLPLAAWGREHGHTVRFIEYMDVGTTNGWRLDDVVPAAEVVDRIAARWRLEPVPPARPGEVATRYRYADGAGEVGVIASVTAPFCRTCSRARLSAIGEVYTCLFASQGHDLRPVLRGGGTDADLDAAIRDVWTRRGDRYSELRTRATAPREHVEMSYIGG